MKIGDIVKISARTILISIGNPMTPIENKGLVLYQTNMKDYFGISIDVIYEGNIYNIINLTDKEMVLLKE